jgi:hypothetical protein
VLPEAEVIYSVGVTGLIDRLSRQPIEKYTALIRKAADSVARAIRHRHHGNGVAEREPRPALDRAMEAPRPPTRAESVRPNMRRRAHDSRAAR